MSKEFKIITKKLLNSLIIINIIIFTLLAIAVNFSVKTSNKNLMSSIQLYIDMQAENFTPDRKRIQPLLDNFTGRYSGKYRAELNFILEDFNNFFENPDSEKDLLIMTTDLISFHTKIKEQWSSLFQIIMYILIAVISIQLILISIKVKKRRQILNAQVNNKETRALLYNERNRERAKICANLQTYVKQDFNILLDSPEIKNGGIMSEIIKISNNINDLPNKIEPSILKTAGLKTSLRTMLDEIRNYGLLKIEYNFYGFNEELISDDCKLVFYRICQEAISNIINHSEADQVEFSLNYCHPFLVMSILDNGKGLSGNIYNIKTSHNHLGLDLMKKKALSIGANLEIKSEKNNGTSIILKYNIVSHTYAAM